MIAASASAQASSQLSAPEDEDPAAPAVALELETDDEVQLVVPPAPDLELDGLRLGELLQDQAREESQGETFAGIVSLGLGGLELGAGLWMALDDGTFASLDSLRWTAVALAIPLGVLGLVSGVASFSHGGVRGDRLSRWRNALEGNLDARQLGRFEGELRAEAETARVLRGFEAAAGFGVTGGGAALMLVTALSNADDLGQMYGYGVGGALTVAGLISGLVALFVESDAEETWRAYVAGEGPERSEAGVDLRVSPSVSEEGFGLSLEGRF